MNQPEFYRLLWWHYHNCGQPADVAKFTRNILLGGHGQARKSKQKSPFEYSQEREKRLTEQGLCVICGKRKPDGVRSKVQCTVCLDRRKLSQAKNNARREQK